MASQPCDGCGEQVPVAGGVANLWTLEKDTTGGIGLELVDGTDQFLCSTVSNDSRTTRRSLPTTSTGCETVTRATLS